MRERIFDEFARGAANGVTRRHSLLALGGAALATALAAPRQVEAGKNSKKAKKKCKRQVGQCTAFFEELCEGAGCEPEELEAALECCSFLRSCNAAAHLECVVDLLTAG